VNCLILDSETGKCYIGVEIRSKCVHERGRAVNVSNVWWKPEFEDRERDGRIMLKGLLIT